MVLELKQSINTADEKVTVLTSGKRILINGQKWVSLLSLGEGFHIAAKAKQLCPAPIYLINENDDQV